jgi:TRAP transporter TAXI family solute receptor
MFRFTKAAMTVMAGLAVAAATLPAQAQSVDETRSKVNQHVVGIMSGTPGSTDLALAADLSLAFSDGYDLRIIPMVSEGSVREVEDLLFLRGVDMAVVQQDVIDFMVQNQIHPNIQEQIRLVAPLSIDQFHLLARSDIRSIEDLTGQKVNYGPTETGSFMTASVVFEALNLDVEVITEAHQVALEMLRRGEIAAMVRVSSKPVSTFDGIGADEGLRLIPLLTERLAGIYAPTTLTTTDYPALIDPGQTINTVAIANALITYNWPRDHARGQAVARFAQAFIGGFDKLLSGDFHEAWQEIDISAEIPGIQHYWAVEEAWAAATQ